MEKIYRAPPKDLVEAAIEQRCRSIAYTYSDPVIFYEYVYDTAVEARRKGLKNVMVTAGYINKKPLRRLCSVLDATNTDLKAFSDRFYRENCSGTLRPVLDALVTFREEGVWVEVTNLIIPTLNDDMAMIRRMARWIAGELGAGTPLHLSRFHPQYRMRNLPPTPEQTLVRARAEAMDAGLEYVYVGNLFGHDAESTVCPRDGKLLVRRSGYRIRENNLVDGACPVCRESIPGVWS
jgi:pyruvate formate lyase activating enzyme